MQKLHMQEITRTIGFACLGVILTTAQPVCAFKRYLGITELAPRRITRLLAQLLGCSLCLSWWITLGCTWDVLMASTSAVAAELISRQINNIKINIK